VIRATSDSPRYRTTFSDGKREGVADITADKGGGGSGFRPHCLLEAALATCVNMTVRMYADNHGIPLAGVITRVSLDRSALTKPRFDTRSNLLAT
jgi:putative redox protein